jgi:hypothetical protein
MIGKKITYKITDKINETVSYFYENETAEFHKNTHKNHGTVQENIDDTCRCISDDEVMYEIRVGDNLAAFFTKFTHGEIKVLNSFHIAKEYRVRWFIKSFWKIVDNEFNGKYYAGLYSKNLDAILHLIRNGFEQVNEVWENEKKFIILSKISNN